MRDVDCHPQPIHLVHHILAEIAEAILRVLHLRVVHVARRIRPAIRIRPRQRHIPHAQPVVVAQQPQRALDRVPALNPHQRRQLVFPMSPLDILRRVSHHHLVRMFRRRLMHAVDQFQRSSRIMPLIQLRLNPDRKELRAQIPLLRRSKI